MTSSFVFYFVDYLDGALSFHGSCMFSPPCLEDAILAAGRPRSFLFLLVWHFLITRFPYWHSSCPTRSHCVCLCVSTALSTSLSGHFLCSAPLEVDGCLYIHHFFHYIVPPLRQRSILLIFVHFKKCFIPSKKNESQPPIIHSAHSNQGIFFKNITEIMLPPYPNPPVIFLCIGVKSTPPSSVHKSRMIWSPPASPTRTDHLKLVSAWGPLTGCPLSGLRFLQLSMGLTSSCRSDHTFHATSSERPLWFSV